MTCVVKVQGWLGDRIVSFWALLEGDTVLNLQGNFFFFTKIDLINFSDE